MLASHLSPN